jgi:prevent-host-death family protein
MGDNRAMETITSTEAKNQLNRLLADVKAGRSFTITNHGQPVAQLVPITAVPRRFGQLPNLVVPKNFDDPLPAAELATWEDPDA